MIGLLSKGGRRLANRWAWAFALLVLGVGAYAQREQLAALAAETERVLAERGLARGESDAARRHLERALRLDARNVEARRHLARIEAAGSRSAHAFLHWQTLIEIEPLDSEAEAALAHLRAPPDGAAVPADPFWPGELGAAVASIRKEIGRRDWAAALGRAESALREYPGAMFGGWLAGVTRFSQGQLDEAERQFLNALALAPRSSRAVTSLAGTWARQRGPAYAAERLVVLAEHDPEFALPRRIASDAFLESRQPARAEEILRRGLALQPGTPIPYRDLALLYRALDRATDAVVTCEQGLAQFAGDEDLRMLKAALLDQLGRAVDAQREYEAVLGVSPENTKALSRLARIVAESSSEVDRIPRVRALLARLEEAASTDIEVLDATGWAYFKIAEPRRALPWLEAAAGGGAGDPAIAYHLAAAYSAIGRQADARRVLQRALATGQPFRERPDAQRLLKSLDAAPAAQRRETR